MAFSKKQKIYYDNILNKEFLINQYINKQLSTREIGKNIGTNKTLILRYLKKYNIETREPSYRNEHSKYRKTDLTKEFLQREYKDKQRTLKDIAKEICCDKTTVSRYVKRYGLGIKENGCTYFIKCSTCGKNIKRYGYQIKNSKDGFCSKKCFQKHRSLNNPMHIKETRAKMIASRLLIKPKPDSIRKNSYCCRICADKISWKSALYGDGYCRKCNPIGDFRCEYNNMLFRSSWEANFAKWCDGSDIKWVFEPQVFKLTVDGKETTYLPDFYLPEFDLWIEIKGWFRPKAKRKYEKFKKVYSEINIELFNECKLQELSIVK